MPIFQGRWNLDSRELFRAAGWKPYSLHVSGTWFLDWILTVQIVSNISSRQVKDPNDLDHELDRDLSDVQTCSVKCCEETPFFCLCRQ